jgi:CTD small phosphatase-like protein 2
VIVDNSIYAFAFHIDNGIPILNYYDNDTDDELYHLQDYMMRLAECSDVRQENRNCF